MSLSVGALIQTEGNKGIYAACLFCTLCEISMMGYNVQGDKHPG